MSLDSPSILDIGTVTATAINVGRAGQTTTVNSSNLVVNSATVSFNSSTVAVTGSVQFVDSGDGHSVSLVAPGTMPASVAYTLPEAPVSSGLALTSSTGGVMTWMAVSAGNPTSYRYIVGPAAGMYSTVQAAIAQAVFDGATNSTPAVIFVTEGTYSGDIVLADGIYVVAAPVVGFNIVASARANNTGPPANGASANLPVKFTGRIFVTQFNTTAATPNTINCGLSGVQLNYDTASTSLFNFSSQSGSGNAGAAIRLFLEQVYGAFSNVSLFGYGGNTDASGSVVVFAQGCVFDYVGTPASTAQVFALDSTCTSGSTFHSLTLDATDCFFALRTTVNPLAYGQLFLTMSRTTVTSIATTSMFTLTSAGAFSWTMTDCSVAATPSGTSLTLITHSGTGAVSVTGVRSSIQVGPATTVNFQGSLLRSTGSAPPFVNLTNCINLPPANPMFGGAALTPVYFVDLSANTYGGGSLTVALTGCATQPQTNGTDTQYAGLDFAVGHNSQNVKVVNLSIPNGTYSAPLASMDLEISFFIKQVRMTYRSVVKTASTSPKSLIDQDPTATSALIRLPNSSMTTIRALVTAAAYDYSDIYSAELIGAFRIDSSGNGTLYRTSTEQSASTAAYASLVAPASGSGPGSAACYFDLQANAPSMASYAWNSVVELVTLTSVGAL
jgi:hypothetical protein